MALAVPAQSDTKYLSDVFYPYLLCLFVLYCLCFVCILLRVWHKVYLQGAR